MPKQVHEVPSAPRPIGPYSVATEANGFVFLSGQVAIDPESNEPVQGDVEEQTHQVMRNIGRALDDLGLGYDDIIKTTIYLDDIGDFPSVNGVRRVPERVASGPLDGGGGCAPRRISGRDRDHRSQIGPGRMAQASSQQPKRPASCVF